jgi:hypothetical protein
MYWQGLCQHRGPAEIRHPKIVNFHRQKNGDLPNNIGGMNQEIDDLTS